MKLSEALTELGRPVAFYPAIARCLGGVPEALLLCQLVYWHDRAQNRDGWVWKTAEEFSEETALSYKEQKRARHRLRALQVLQERPDRLRHRTFFRIDLEALDSLWRRWLDEGRPDRRKSSAKAQAACSKLRDIQTGRFVSHPGEGQSTDETNSREARIERQRKKLAAQAALLLAQQEVS